MHDDFSISPAVTHWVTGSGKLANIKAALQDIDATNPMSGGVQSCALSERCMQHD
jgi:hypothetical protein